MSIRLIAFDLDGTLLRNDKTVSERTMKALQRAADHGIYLVPSTGRIFDAMPEVVRNMPFVRYAITVNGAAVYDAAEKRMLYEADLTWEEAEAVFAYTKEFDAICGCYQKGVGWMEETEFEQLPAYAANAKILEMLKSVYHPMKNLQKEIFSQGSTIQKLIYFFQEIPERDRKLQETKERFPNLEISTSLPNNIEVNSAGANKGLGLKCLCDHLGLRLEECMAFGDGTNDLAILKTAGRGVAMANAAMEVLEAVPYRTLSNEEDGVAVEIERCLEEN